MWKEGKWKEIDNIASHIRGDKLLSKNVTNISRTKLPASEISLLSIDLKFAPNKS